MTHTGKVTDRVTNPEKQSIDSLDMTNNFYDNTETLPLPVKELIIEGEIANPGKVDFSDFPYIRLLLRKPFLTVQEETDLLALTVTMVIHCLIFLTKGYLKSQTAKSLIRLLIFISKLKMRKVKRLYSAGVKYTILVNLHKIIIATSVSRIVPSKTKELWPLPVESRIVAASDLVTERNISSPVKITVKSYPVSLTVNRELSPLYSQQIDLFSAFRKRLVRLTIFLRDLNNVTFNTIFYGRGKGIHSTSPFSGILLKDLLLKYYPVSRENLRSGIFCIAGIDGYRCAVSYSELFNRNDQQEFLLIKLNLEKTEDFSVFSLLQISFPTGQ